jgi:curved DNA-binding protein CbpA
MVTFQKSRRGGELPDHYRTLGVTPAATFREIEAAYWRLAFASDQRDMPGLNAAYEVLGNDGRRRAYDLQRRATGLDPQDATVAGGGGAAAPEAQRPASLEPGLSSRLGWPSI